MQGPREISDDRQAGLEGIFWGHVNWAKGYASEEVVGTKSAVKVIGAGYIVRL